MRNFPNLAKVALLLALTALPAGAAGNHLFQSDYPSLLKQMTDIEIPVILPTKFPDGNAGLYARKLQIATDDYQIAYWSRPDCNEVTVCRYAHMIGGRPSKMRLSGKRVYLKQFGVRGYVLLGRCGFGCEDSTLAFEIHGWRYVFGSKGADEEFMVRTAQSLRYFKTPSRTLQAQHGPRERPAAGRLLDAELSR